MGLNFEGPEGQSSKSRCKNGVICLVRMFKSFPGLWSLKSEKQLIFVSSADGSKNLAIVWGKYLGEVGSSFRKLHG